MYWVYILDNYLKRDFVSVTISMETRIEEHKEEMREAGENPEKLTVLHQEYHNNPINALAREKEFKKMSTSKLHKFLRSKEENETSITY